MFEDALKARLDIMQPSLSHVEHLQKRPPPLTTGVKYVCHFRCPHCVRARVGWPSRSGALPALAQRGLRCTAQRACLLLTGALCSYLSCREFVELLRAKGKHVYLVSGGFRQMIYPVADELGIPHSNVFANNLLFDEATGAYAGFDPNEPTSRSGGKRRVMEQIMVCGFVRACTRVRLCKRPIVGLLCCRPCFAHSDLCARRSGRGTL